ncbi:TonB-dependent receptor [Spirosoma fluminis]
MKSIRLFSILIVANLLPGKVSAQQPAPAAESVLRGLGMQPDTTRPVATAPSATLQPDSTDQPNAAGRSSLSQPSDTANTLSESTQTAPGGAITTQASEAIGTLKGRLMAKQATKNQAVAFASIGLFRISDSSSVTGSLTDEKGFFIISNLAPGTYYALVQSLGYAPKRIPRITIGTSSATVNLGDILLTETSTQLQEVVVQGQRQAYEYSLDRKIVNADQLPIAQGGSALDILQNVPSVTVDVDGTLSLRGSSNVIVLVDGKPSGLTGLDRQAILDQIPASNIERVEIITNPSSRYDADGAAGIINIILKKEQASGFNGNIQLNVGTRDKYNASVNLNARFKKLNLFGSYNFRDYRRFQYRISDRKNLFDDSTSYLSQRNDAIRRNASNNLRLGFDYALSGRDNITLSTLYRPRYSYDSEFEVFNTQDARRESLGITRRSTEEREPERGLDYTFGYRRNFAKKGRELTFDATLSTNRGTENQLFTNSTTLPENLLTPNFLIGRQRASNFQNNRVGVLQTDFIEPLKRKQRLETGLKYTYRRLGADYVFENLLDDGWVVNPNISNNFIYNEQTSAAYVNFGNELKKFSYQAGLRTEYTTILTDQRTTGQQNQRDYIYLFPSAFINYSLSQEQKLQLNYTRRINRPSVRSLNPFVDLSDPLNIRFGNPLLSPELINSFEMSYLWNGKSTSLNTSLFFRQTNNEITSYRTLRNDGITEQTSLNLNRSQNYGLEVVANQDITDWWKVNGTFTFFQRSIQASANVPGVLTRTNRSWTGRITTDLRPKRGTAIQVAVNYRSPFIVAQGTINSFFNVDAGIKQDILKGRGTLNFRVSDIFNTLQFQNDSFGPNFLASTLGKRESRIGFIGFTYRLNRKIVKETSRQKEEQENDNSPGDIEY